MCVSLRACVCVQVLANLVMEDLLPSLTKDMLPRLKSKKTERKRVWFAVSLKRCSSPAVLPAALLIPDMLYCTVTCYTAL